MIKLFNLEKSLFTRFRNTLYALLLAGLTATACQSRVGTAVTPSVFVPPPVYPTVTATTASIPSLSPSPEATVSDLIPPVPVLSPIPEAVWTYETGAAIWGTPAVSESSVYFGSDDGNLYSLDAQDGALKWSFQTQGIVRSRPAIVGDLIYFSSDDGYLYVLDVQSGTQVWRTDIGNYLPRDERVNLGTDTSPTGWDYKQSSPVVEDGRVFIGSLDGKVYALAADTGAVLWMYQTGQKVRATPVLADGVLYIGSWDKTMYALDTQTGQLLWNVPVRGEVQTTALVIRDLVITASRRASVMALDAQTGEMRWEQRYGDNMWVESSPLLVDNVIYIGSSGKQPIKGFDVRTGNIHTFFFTEAYNLSTPTVSNDILLIGGMSFVADENVGGLYGLRLVDGKFTDPKQAYWYFPVLEQEAAERNWSGVASSPVIQDGIVYFGGLDGSLYAVEISR